MTRLLLACLSWFGTFFRSRHDLGLELVALRQQVGVLKCKNPRPQSRLCDRLFLAGSPAVGRGWARWRLMRHMLAIFYALIRRRILWPSLSKLEPEKILLSMEASSSRLGD